MMTNERVARVVVGVAMALACSSAAADAQRTVSGVGRNGLAWEARNTIIGQTPTSDVLPPINDIGGGSAIYKPTADKDGVVALIMEYENGSRFICSGSLLADGRSIATAAHCVSTGAGTANPMKTTAYFFNGDPDTRTPNPATSIAIEVTNYAVHPNYTGEVIDQNDIAVLRLASAAPASADRYDLFTSVITGSIFNVAGYGARSTVGGASGTTGNAAARTGYLREGDNRYDYAFGDPRFQGFFTTRDVAGPFIGQNFFGFAEVEFSYISDFDNGLAAQSQARRLANGLGLGPIGNTFFNDNGQGAREVGIGGGDSGGPGFINGQLASINSYGLTFGTNFGDFTPGLNNSWGELSGYVPVYIHEDFINSSLVPEPSTYMLFGTGLVMIGYLVRRRRLS